MIVVRQQNSSQSHHDFHIRRSKVVGALQWLLANNVCFRNITIDDEIVFIFTKTQPFHKRDVITENYFSHRYC